MVMLTTWDGNCSAEESIEILSDLSLAHCQEAGEAGNELADLIRRRDFLAICEWDIKYDGSYTAHQLLHLRQALGFFTKLEDLDIGVDKDAAARRKFHVSEVECLRTNLLFNQWLEGDICFPLPVGRVLYEARRKIAAVLGEVPSLDKLDFKFGPGATTSVQKRNACARTKLSAVPSCSSNMLPLIPALTAELPRYFGIHAVAHGEVETVPVVVTHGKVSFVPKNAKTYRTVMTEPTLNALVQGGIGRYIARRLRRVGQDIKDQVRNQRLAREGSLTGALATLDLSSASDSISSELVAHLVPVDWYALLSLCRTPSVQMGDHVLHLQKFSSMGNGYTFPLQTLIFWALAVSCVEDVNCAEQRVSVYGDDIIMGTDAVSLMRQVLHCTGFTLNKEKSYWSGPFRESCGADYYAGIDIRPCYVDSWVNGATLFTIHNFYKRNYMDEFAERVKKFISPGLAIYGPDGYGDGHLLGDWTPRRHKRIDGYAGYLFDTYTYKPRYHTRVMPGDGVLPCYSTYVRSTEIEPEEAAIMESGTAAMRPSNPEWVTYQGDCSVKRDLTASTPDSFYFRASDDPARATNPTLHRKKRGGEWVPWLVTPGVDGYHKISIYTLSVQ